MVFPIGNRGWGIGFEANRPAWSSFLNPKRRGARDWGSPVGDIHVESISGKDGVAIGLAEAPGGRCGIGNEAPKAERSLMKSGEFEAPLRILALVFIFFSLASCSSRPDIIGKWREVGKTATMEFSADGAFRAMDNQGMAVAGKFTLSKDGTMQCEIQREGTSGEVVKVKISIKGNELTVTDSDGRKGESYRRIKGDALK